MFDGGDTHAPGMHKWSMKVGGLANCLPHSLNIIFKYYINNLIILR